MPRCSLLSLLCVLAFGTVARAEPIAFDYYLRYDGTVPLTLLQGTPGSVSVKATGGMAGYVPASESASTTLDYTITGTAPASAPSLLDVAVLNFSLFVKDASTGAEWMYADSVYMSGTVSASGHATTEFLDGPALVPFTVTKWLSSDHEYMLGFNFLPTAQNNSTGEIDVSIQTSAAPKPADAPEPCTLLLAGVGLAVPVLRRVRKKWQS